MFFNIKIFKKKTTYNILTNFIMHQVTYVVLNKINIKKLDSRNEVEKKLKS